MNKIRFQSIIVGVSMLSSVCLAAQIPTLVLPGANTQIMTQEEEKVIEPDTHHVNMSYIKVKDQILIPFREIMNLIGISNIDWKGNQTAGIYSYLTVEIPGYFEQNYYSNLKRGLQERTEEDIEKLPVALQDLIKINNTSPSTQISDLNNKGIEVIINSQGYRTGFMLYNYQHIDGKLYVNPKEFKGFGIQDIAINEDQKYASVTYKTQQEIDTEVKEGIESIQKILRTLTQQEIISLWIRAQQTRSGALQHSLLSEDLQAKVIEEAKFRGWVTGGSSPTLLGGKILVIKINEINEKEIEYTIQYESMLQGKVYETLKQVVELKNYTDDKGSYWKISDVKGDIGYYTFQSITHNK